MVIPKEVRDRLSLTPDAQLELDTEGDSIRLTPVRERSRSIVEIDGWPVIAPAEGHTVTDADVQRWPTNADRFAVDTSVAVPALDAGHAAHDACRFAVASRRPTLAGHAALETFSVLTRMPGALAIDGPTAAEILRRVFREVSWITGEQATGLLTRCGPLGITGGAVYDAVVGEAARVDQRTLLTRGRRASRTYDLLGVAYQFVGTS